MGAGCWSGWVGGGWLEASALGWAGGVDGVAVSVDEVVVVVPAEGGEVVGVVVPRGGVPGDVVGLESVAGLAAVGGAGLVSGEDVASEAGWDGA